MKKGQMCRHFKYQMSINSQKSNLEFIIFHEKCLLNLEGLENFLNYNINLSFRNAFHELLALRESEIKIWLICEGYVDKKIGFMVIYFILIAAKSMDAYQIAPFLKIYLYPEHFSIQKTHDALFNSKITKAIIDFRSLFVLSWQDLNPTWYLGQVNLIPRMSSCHLKGLLCNMLEHTKILKINKQTATFFKTRDDVECVDLNKKKVVCHPNNTVTLYRLPINDVSEHWKFMGWLQSTSILFLHWFSLKIYRFTKTRCDTHKFSW